jgi:uncharacterized membrane protein
MSSHDATHHFERLLGRTLGIGIAVSTIVLAAGLALSLASNGAAGTVLLHAGLLTLMATPMLRVLLSCVEYVRQRDWFFAANALGVLVILGITIYAAWAR